MSIKILTGNPGLDGTEDLSNDQIDAQLILEYVMAQRQSGGTDYGPPESAWEDGSKAHENEDAWKILDQRGQLPIAKAEALSYFRSWDPAKHPRTPKGKEGGGRFTDVPGGVGLLERAVKPITRSEARGNSRAVSMDEFQDLASEGRRMMEDLDANKSPIDLKGKALADLKASTFAEVQKSWGGATIDSHTGKPLQSNADAYAISVKPADMETISIPEGADRPTFDRAMDRARQRFEDVLESQKSYLGVFHDDDNNRIDFDPVTVVDSPHEVEAIGTWTHAIGGAYHFKSGDGYFPPHVDDTRNVDTSLGKKVHWKGPGQWRSHADKAQRKGA